MDMAQKRLEGRITRHRRIRKKVNGISYYTTFGKTRQITITK